MAWKLAAISGVVTTAATGCPLPIGLPMVTMSGTTPEFKTYIIITFIKGYIGLGKRNKHHARLWDHYSNSAVLNNVMIITNFFLFTHHRLERTTYEYPLVRIPPALHRQYTHPLLSLLTWKTHIWHAILHRTQSGFSELRGDRKTLRGSLAWITYTCRRTWWCSRTIHSQANTLSRNKQSFVIFSKSNNARSAFLNCNAFISVTNLLEKYVVWRKR